MTSDRPDELERLATLVEQDRGLADQFKAVRKLGRLTSTQELAQMLRDRAAQLRGGPLVDEYGNPE